MQIPSRFTAAIHMLASGKVSGGREGTYIKVVTVWTAAFLLHKVINN